MTSFDKLFAGYNARKHIVIQDKQRVYGLRYTLSSGRKEYYFLLIDPLKERAFQRALKGAAVVRLDDYGTIVGHGEGEPSDALKERIGASYQVIFN